MNCVISIGELNPGVVCRLVGTPSCTSASWENGVGVAWRLLFSLILFVGRDTGLFVAIGAIIGDSIVGVPFYIK